MIPRRLLAFGALAVLVGAPAASAAVSAGSLAARLERDPVVAAPGTLPAADAARLRRVIVRQDRGRVRVAVLGSAPAGGAQRFAERVGKELGPHHGVLVVAAGSNLVTATSLADRSSVVSILQAAQATRPTLAAQLAYAVPFVARTDPGPVADRGPVGPRAPLPSRPATGGGGAGKTVALVLGGLVLVGLLAAIVRIVLRGSRAGS